MASIALIRFLQSRHRSFFSKSRPSGPIRPKRRSMSPFDPSQSLRPSHPGSSDQPGILCSLGLPSSLKMRTHWSMSERPSRIGLFSNISPKTHLSTSAVDFMIQRATSIPNSPHVNGWGVALQLEQQLWRTVPPGHDQAGVISNSLSIALARLGHHAVVIASQTEIGNL